MAGWHGAPVPGDDDAYSKLWYGWGGSASDVLWDCDADTKPATVALCKSVAVANGEGPFTYRVTIDTDPDADAFDQVHTIATVQPLARWELLAADTVAKSLGTVTATKVG